MAAGLGKLRSVGFLLLLSASVVFVLLSARSRNYDEKLQLGTTMKAGAQNRVMQVGRRSTIHQPLKALKMCGDFKRGVVPVRAIASGYRPSVFTVERLDLTPANVEVVLDEVRPYLQADGGSVDFVEIDGPLVKLRLKGACSSCASSSTTMQLGIKRRLQERIEGVGEVVDVGVTEEKMEVSLENIEKILDEIRPYLVGASGGSLDYVGGLEQNNVKIKITGPAAKIMTVRVAIQQKIKEKFPNMVRVELVA
mmetsp:Transcript_194/g.269  ORF Transcript_194/g.269 Transcript_194/m.269 type:complete len:252 (-) Transcript_194:238-993(-)|eukprot:jgi/Bigna1/48123/estExt_Genewise1.C_220195